MSTESTFTRRATIATALAGAVGTIASASPASAAERTCSADSRLKTARDIEWVQEKLLTRQTLEEIHLQNWRGLGDLFLRMRMLTIEPGGFVPTHFHDDRPSILYLIKGELVEHSTFCTNPIFHKAGDWSAEFGPKVGHWWENRGKETAIVLSADVIPPEYRDMDTMDM